MNSVRKAAVLVGALAVLFPSLVPAAGRVNWYDYKEARALGKSQEKKVFLYFRSDNCTYCRQMEKETLSAPEVARFLNRHFISARIDTDRNPKVSAQYRVVGLPTSYFISDDGARIGGLPGFQPSDRFLAFLRFLQTDSYREMSFTEFLKR
jgi:thioredoxin-related protein